jgi:hypothetical protein
MGDPFAAAAVTANVYAAGDPAVGAVAGGVMVSVGAPATLTVTDPEAVPVPPGLVGLVGLVGFEPPPGTVVVVVLVDDPA